MDKKKIKRKLKIINKIEKARSKNNTNWMDVLRLAFRHAPKDASKLLKKIHSQDKTISNLASKLSK